MVAGELIPWTKMFVKRICVLKPPLNQEHNTLVPEM